MPLCQRVLTSSLDFMPCAPHSATLHGLLDLTLNRPFYLVLQAQALKAKLEITVRETQGQRTELQQPSQESVEQHAALRQALQVGLLLRCPET